MTRQIDTITQHPAGSPAAVSAAIDARAALAATSTADLLTKAYALTHRIDAARAARAESRGAVEYAKHHNEAADLRAQRDLITAEVLRRTGGQ